MNIDDFYFIWLSLVNIDKLSFIKLIRINTDICELYKLTLVPEKFSSYLKMNNIFVSKTLFQNLINKKIKIESKKIYNLFLSKKIKVIHFFSKEYNNFFSNSQNAPLVVFLLGNIDLLNSKVIYVYSENYNKYENKIIINNLVQIIKRKKYSIIENNNIFGINKIVLKEFSDIYNIDKYKIERDKLYIFYNCDYYNIVSVLTNKLIIIDAKYKKEAVYLIDSMLENGKDIEVFPNSILKKEAYFSNYLISEGAKIILNFNEI